MISANFFETIVSKSRSAVLVTEPDGSLRYANQAAHDLFELDNDSATTLPQFLQRLDQQQSEQFIKFRRSSDDRMHWLECNLQKIEVDGELHSVISCRDVTFEKKRERRLQKEATTDFLSGLANRREFQNLLETNCDRPICLAIIDVDHFKQINDQHGHLIGDAAIRFVAEQMLKSFFDSICVARLGGEEFGVIVDTTREDAIEQLETFRVALERASFSEHRIKLTVSVGIAVSSDASDAYALLECADKAVYESKKLGRNRSSIFELKQV